jgi:hypothetical protein
MTHLARLAYIIPCRDGRKFALAISCGTCGLIPGNSAHALHCMVERLCPVIMQMVDLTGDLACRRWEPRGEK